MLRCHCVLPVLLILSVPAHAADQRPNVLFVAVDDLRTELGCYGKEWMHSPNIDRWAARALVLERAYCQQAVCSPSRSSLLTGTRPDTTKVWDLATHFRKAIPDVVTLPQHFKNHGYFVQGMGKIYHGGFDDPPSWSVPWSSPKAKPYGLPENNALVAAKAKAAAAAGKTGTEASRAARGPAFEASDVPDETFHDGSLAQMAIEALRSMKEKDQPFFLAVGFIRPHLPFVAPQKYWDQYDSAKIELASNPFRPKGAPDFAIGDGGEMTVYEGVPKFPIPDDYARQLKHGYYAAVSYMDAQFGKVMDELDRLGLRDNTIVVLWGDHGWKLGEHLAWCKHSNVENDTNAPLIISAPTMKAAGRHSAALVEFVDIYPTLCDLAGLAKPQHLEGHSFAPLMDNPDQPWKTAAFSQYPRSSGKTALMGYTMRTDRYRYTRWVERNDHSQVVAVELYDHRSDPQENVNVAADPANANILEILSAQFDKGWRGPLAN
jgi:iduronate 2-sulfatase